MRVRVAVQCGKGECGVPSGTTECRVVRDDRDDHDDGASDECCCHAISAEALVTLPLAITLYQTQTVAAQAQRSNAARCPSESSVLLGPHARGRGGS